MADTGPRETARIYDLSAFRRLRATRPVGAQAKPARPACGDGAWYHEAALREEDPSRQT